MAGLVSAAVKHEVTIGTKVYSKTTNVVATNSSKFAATVANGTPQTLDLRVTAAGLKFIAVKSNQPCTISFTNGATPFVLTLAAGEQYTWPNGAANPFGSDNVSAAVVTSTTTSVTASVEGEIGYDG